MKFDVRDTRNKNWMWMRRELIREDGDELGAYGIAVYSALASYADDSSTAYPSLSSIAEMIDCSRRQVQREIKKLHRLDWIAYEERQDDKGGDTSHLFYLLECPHDSQSHGGATDSHTGCDSQSHKVERKEVSSNNSARDAVEDDPVTVYRDFFEYQLNNIQKKQIRERVDDLDLWRAVLQWWSMNGHRNRSVGRMLNKYGQVNSPDELYRDSSGDGHQGDAQPLFDENGDLNICPRTGKVLQ